MLSILGGQVLYTGLAAGDVLIQTHLGNMSFVHFILPVVFHALKARC